MRHRTSWIGLLLLALAIAAAPAGAEPASSAIGQERGQPERIDVNQADERLLQTVPGIGPAMARRIVDWRDEHGPFRRLEDLLDIRGIGEKTLEKFRAYLMVVVPEDRAG